jgi:hypothetical protein
MQKRRENRGACSFVPDDPTRAPCSELEYVVSSLRDLNLLYYKEGLCRRLPASEGATDPGHEVLVPSGHHYEHT